MRTLRLASVLMLAGMLASPATVPAASDMDSPAPESVTAVIAKGDHACLVTAPEGWVLDGQSGREDGLDAVLYPHGSTWTGARAIMYALVVPAEGLVSLERFIVANMAEARRRSPKLTVGEPGDLTLSDGRRATIRTLKGDTRGNLERVAFIRESGAVVMIVLTSRDLTQFEQSRPAFESLVTSYQPVAITNP
jgi:hypothetical protein